MSEGMKREMEKNAARQKGRSGSRGREEGERGNRGESQAWTAKMTKDSSDSGDGVRRRKGSKEENQSSSGTISRSETQQNAYNCNVVKEESNQVEFLLLSL